MKIKKIVNLMMGLSFSLCIFAQDDWQLVWSDEFDTDGSLNSSVWNFSKDMRVMKKFNGTNPTMQFARMGC
jgi:beta-glucanase (GH16 family)